MLRPRPFPLLAMRARQRLGRVLVLATALAIVPTVLAHDPPADLRALDAAIKETPGDPTLHFRRGEVYLQLEAARQALADFERVASLRVDYPRIELARGRALRALGRHDDAIAAAERELARNPRSGEAETLRARSLAALGRKQAALEAWDRALALAPARPEHYLERATAAADTAGMNDAISGLDRAEHDVGPMVVLQERAIALCEESGRYDEAIRRLDRLLATAARPESWLAWKARLLDRAGRKAAAAATRQAALVAIESLPDAKRRTPAMRSLAAGLTLALRDAPLVPPAMSQAASLEMAPSPLDQPAPAPVLEVAPAPIGSLLLPRASWWRYADAGNDLGTAWRSPTYDDSGWRVGLAKLGFGAGDESATLDGGPAGDRIPTTYFRREFTVGDPAWFARAHIELACDDGAVVYLNGTELTRRNMPDGVIEYRTLASSELTGQEGRKFTPITFPANLLVAGTNVLAVEVHQGSATSIDLAFDLELVGTAQLSVSRGPYLQQATPTAAIVRWRTDAPCGTALWLGPTPAMLSLVQQSAHLTTEHEVKVNGLTPSTRYYYAVGDDEVQLAGATANHWFATSPLSGTSVPTRIWVLGDSGSGDANAAAVRDAYLAFTGARPTDVLLMLGDNAYYSGTDEEYQRAAFDLYPTILRNTFVWPTLGNHDAISARSGTGTGPYYDIFSLPAQGEAGGVASGTEAYYAFDYGRTHFICLDSQDSDRSPASAMLAWLDADLRSCTADWVIAFFHHPPYTRGSHDSDNPNDSEGRLKQMRENALPILERHGVDVVLTGHSHCYERSFLLDGHYGVATTLVPEMKVDRGNGNESGDGAYVKAHAELAPHEGAVYVVAGSSGVTGGGALNHPAHVVSLNEMGSLVLDIDGHRLDARFVGMRGNLRDRFTIVKGQPRWLVRDEPTIRATTGGGQTLRLAAGSEQAGRPYLVVGSLGTTPGFTFGGVPVPLNPDGWFSTTLQLANTAIMQNTVGRLDASGRAQARIVLPPLPASLVGTELWHAFVVMHAAQVAGASNSVKLRIVH